MVPSSPATPYTTGNHTHILLHAVVAPSGVVGITRGVSENYSYVLSFLNTSQQVSAKIGSSNTFGPLSWDGERENMAVLNEIPQHLDVKQQDTVYTSGYSSFYPPDIPLGAVTMPLLHWW